MAADVDLDLENTWLFDEFFTEFSKRPDNAQLLHRMQALNSEGTMSPDEWEAASTTLSPLFLFVCFVDFLAALYRVVIFRKKSSAKRPTTLERPKPRVEIVHGDAILTLN